MLKIDPAHPCFSFLYGGQEPEQWLTAAQTNQTTATQDGTVVRTLRYTLPDGLVVTQTIREWGESGALHWVLDWENTGSADSSSISRVWDCDVTFPFEPDQPVVPGFQNPASTLKVVSMVGSNAVRDDFTPREQQLFMGAPLTYSCWGGRSSQGLMPFFDLNHGERGVLAAIGWTGQWTATFTRGDGTARIQTGIDGVDLILHPGEHIRTSSILLLPYENGQRAAHVAFRRIIKHHFSLIGKPGRPENGPLCMMNWGALSSEKMCERVRGQKERGLGFEYLWVDAGWYGMSTQPCPNEHVGDWFLHTGDWRINPTYHPDGMADVTEEVRRQGMKFLMWIEPERVLCHTPACTEHPDWFFQAKDGGDNRLLNLGNPDARRSTVETVAGIIEKLGLSCYRQDFNIDPLPFWTENDEPGRAGMNQILYIMGLYAFWDELLARVPHLIIDNCSSGGRRIDIETLSRSIPLWRSDLQCTFNCDAEASQCHNTGISWWIPYSGTGMGSIIGDQYRTRSCYSNALVSFAWGYDGWDFREDQDFDEIRAQLEEYKQVRPYFSCDYYPIFGFPVENTSWTGWQFDRPEQGDGILLAFRRPASENDHAVVYPGGLREEAVYVFTDADTKEETRFTGRQLKENGFPIQIDTKRSSKLFFYRSE